MLEDQLELGLSREPSAGLRAHLPADIVGAKNRLLQLHLALDKTFLSCFRMAKVSSTLMHFPKCYPISEHNIFYYFSSCVLIVSEVQNHSALSGIGDRRTKLRRCKKILQHTLSRYYSPCTKTASSNRKNKYLNKKFEHI